MRWILIAVLSSAACGGGAVASDAAAAFVGNWSGSWTTGNNPNTLTISSPSAGTLLIQDACQPGYALTATVGGPGSFTISPEQHCPQLHGCSDSVVSIQAGGGTLGADGRLTLTEHSVAASPSCCGTGGSGPQCSYASDPVFTGARGN